MIPEERALSQCTVVLTRDCNLRCNFCYGKNAGYDKKDSIDFDDLKKIVDFCYEAHIKYIFFSGGEPLLYPYLLEALRYIKNKERSITAAVATNGILLSNPKLCNDLVESGLDYIDVSIKGSDKTRWLSATAYDGFNSQLEAIDNISSLPIELTCSMVVTSENVLTVCDVIEVAKKHGAKQFSFTFLIDNDISDKNGKAYLKKHDPIQLIELFCSQINRINTITDDWWIEYSFPLCLYTKEQLLMLEGRLASPCQVHLKNAITFNTNMDLFACDMYFTSPMGRFGIDFSSYAEFLDFTKNGIYQETIDSIINLPSVKCSSCQHLSSCFGGCPVLWKHYSFDELMSYKDNTLLSPTIGS